MGKGFIGGFMGAFIAIILVVCVIGVGIYIFGPKYLPSSPCLLNSNCEPQKLCCTWRCDSTEIDWWNCPDSVCELLGEPLHNPQVDCECEDLRCKMK
jgi:hypothetical protein